MVLKHKGKTAAAVDIDASNPLERSSFKTGEATRGPEEALATENAPKQKSKLLLILAALAPASSRPWPATTPAAFPRTPPWARSSLRHAVGHPRHVRAAHRGGNDRCENGRCHRQGLRRAYSRVVRHPFDGPGHVCPAHRQCLHHVLRIRRHCIGNGDVRRHEIRGRARGRGGRVAAYRGRQL